MCFIYVSEHGAMLGINGGHLVIRHNDGKVDNIPKELVEGISIFGNSQMTAACIQFVLERQVQVSFFNAIGKYYGSLESFNQDSSIFALKQNEILMDGAILYQIAAMYSYSLPLYPRVKECTVVAPTKEEMSIGAKVGLFAKKYCQDNYVIYTDGLYFFEDIDNRHDEYVDLRKYIEHFKYYANQKKSILDIYSELFGGFFSYNIKLKKSISYILPNILLSNFVVAKLGFDVEDAVYKDRNIKKTKIVVKRLASDYLTYKEISPAILNEKTTEADNSFTFDIASLMQAMNGPVSKTKKNDKNAERTKNKDDKPTKGVSVLARDDVFIGTISRLLAYKQ